MAFTEPLPAAPGRYTVRLERGWAAVLLQILPGGPVAAVGFFRRGYLETVVDDPAEVVWLARALSTRLGASVSAR